MNSITLTLVVNEKWFNKIYNHEKNEDFREQKEYWHKRLIWRSNYKYIKICHGYKKNRASILFEWNGYREVPSTELTDLGIGFCQIELIFWLMTLHTNINCGIDVKWSD